MRKLIFILPFAMMMLGSCLKSDSDNSQPVQITVPVGTFAGQFRKIHRAFSTGKLDTTKLGFTLVMTKDSGYRVTADTSTIHAGSKGGFQLTTSYIYFTDKTLSSPSTAKKIHLSGTYAYYFDGSIFQMANITSQSDTIYYQYDLKKLF